MNRGPQSRGQVEEDAGSCVELGQGPVPHGEVGLLDGHRDTSTARCFLSAFDANGRQVHGVDTEALAGKPDTIAAVTVPWNEDTRAGLKACHLFAKIGVRLFAVDRLGLRKAFVPHQLRIGPFIGLQRNLPLLPGLIVTASGFQTPLRRWMSREMLCCIFRCRR